jgi:16S rRNA G966 N2-methylase RsmD
MSKKETLDEKVETVEEETVETETKPKAKVAAKKKSAGRPKGSTNKSKLIPPPWAQELLDRRVKFEDLEKKLLEEKILNMFIMNLQARQYPISDIIAMWKVYKDKALKNATLEELEYQHKRQETERLIGINRGMLQYEAHQVKEAIERDMSIL